MHFYDRNRYFSPWVLFCRGGLQEAKHSLPIAFRAFVDTYVALQGKSLKKPSILDSSEIKRLQIEYDLYSAKNDPAHGLFQSYFGKQWADRFVNQFLFPGN